MQALVDQVPSPDILINALIQLLSTGNGKMIKSALDDGSYCLDAGSVKTGSGIPGCCSFTCAWNPICSTMGVIAYHTCSNSPWTFFNYNGKMWYNTGGLKVWANYCLQAWDCRGGNDNCEVRGASCN
jgi:hypothetical protein